MKQSVTDTKHNIGAPGWLC